MDFAEKTKEFAISLYDANDIVHGWPHVSAVRENALKLQEILGGDKELIEIAVYLHDCDYSQGIEKHAEQSALKARKFLSSINYSKAEQVAEIIANHSVHTHKPDASLEAKIVFDADKMETLKPYGILRVAIYHGEKSLEEILQKIQQYCVGLYDELYFEESKKMIQNDYEKNKKFVQGLKK